MGDPGIRFAIEAIGTLIVETLIETLEDASMPEVGVGTCTHAGFWLPPFQLTLKLLEELCRHNKESVFFERLGGDISIVIRAQVRKNFKRARSNIFIDITQDSFEILLVDYMSI